MPGALLWSPQGSEDLAVFVEDFSRVFAFAAELRGATEAQPSPCRGRLSASPQSNAPTTARERSYLQWRSSNDVYLGQVDPSFVERGGVEAFELLVCTDDRVQHWRNIAHGARRLDCVWVLPE
jgi:hypothetical protein